MSWPFNKTANNRQCNDDGRARRRGLTRTQVGGTPLEALCGVTGNFVQLHVHAITSRRAERFENQIVRRFDPHIRISFLPTRSWQSPTKRPKGLGSAPWDRLPIWSGREFDIRRVFRPLLGILPTARATKKGGSAKPIIRYARRRRRLTDAVTTRMIILMRFCLDARCRRCFAKLSPPNSEHTFAFF
jgi:hypothetical protein